MSLISDVSSLQVTVGVVAGALLLLLFRKRSSSPLDDIPTTEFAAGTTFEQHAINNRHYADSPLVKLFLGPKPLVIMSTPTHAKKMFTELDTFLRMGFEQLNALIYTFEGENILTANGELWRKYRRAATPAFGKLFSTDSAVSITRTMVDQWQTAIDQGQPIEIVDWMMRLTIDILGKVIMDVEFGTIREDRGTRVAELYTFIMEGLSNMTYIAFPFLDSRLNPWRRPYWNAVDEMSAFFLSIMDDKKRKILARGEGAKQSKREKDVLTLMLESFQDEENPTLTDEEVRGNLATLFLAGHESTASALASHLYYLATHPDVQTKAREEVLSVLDSDDAIQHNTKLPYLEAVIYESLRIHPPTDALPFRAIAHDVQLEGKSGKMHTLPKGSLASLSLTALHNNPDIWMNPHEFRPERFLNQDERESTKHAFMPFGTGPRMCIGMNFSLLEQRIVLSMLLRCFEWTLPADSPHKDGIQSTGFTLLKANPMHLSFTRRP